MQVDHELQRLMRLACDQVEMDAAFLCELDDGEWIVRAVVGHAAAFGLAHGATGELQGGFSEVLGEASPSYVPDAFGDERFRELNAAGAGVGAFVGAPLRLSGGEAFGVLCCVSSTPDPTLDARDARFMELVAAMVAERVEAVRSARQQRREMTELLESGRVEIALQPIVDLTTRRWRGAEALARFPGNTRAVEDVFALSSRAGIGADLELLTLRLALTRLADLPEGMYLSVNVSAEAMIDDRFTDLLATCSKPTQLVIELTEHAPVEAYPSLVETLAPLRRRGVRLAVDDVGAGYASFRHVLRLHPDIIKIDRSLVAGIADDQVLRTIAANIVLLALDLRAVVVAEGVDNSRDLAVLESIGADMAQGHLFARPTTDPAAWSRWAIDLTELERDGVDVRPRSTGLRR